MSVHKLQVCAGVYKGHRSSSRCTALHLTAQVLAHNHCKSTHDMLQVA